MTESKEKSKDNPINSETKIIQPICENPPFGRDAFGYKAVADELTNLVSRLAKGSVIGVDSPWGTGKTYFAKNWQGMLKEKGLSTVYIDAFSGDYYADPFVLIAAQMLQQLGFANKREFAPFRKKALAVARALPGIAIKFAEKVFLPEPILKVAGAVNEAAQQCRDAAEGAKPKETLLSKNGDESGLFTDFKQSLADLLQKRKRPVVVLVDELDRCRPDFAVRLLERLKHLFEVDGLVFVIFAHNDFLEAAVKGTYNFSNDELSRKYLERFIYFQIKLPKIKGTGAYQQYINKIVKRYTLKDSKMFKNFCENLMTFAEGYSLTPRALDLILINYAILEDRISNFDKEMCEIKESPMKMIAWLLVVKACNKKEFYQIKENIPGTYPISESSIPNGSIMTEVLRRGGDRTWHPVASLLSSCCANLWRDLEEYDPDFRGNSGWKKRREDFYRDYLSKMACVLDATV